MKIGILTTFSNWSETYSLVGIVGSQIRMLKKAGHNVVLFVNENFVGDIDCEVRKIVPVFTYTQVTEDNVDLVKTALEVNMQDIDVCFTHDIVLQDSFVVHNKAMRKLNLPIKWFHWIHSQPDGVKNASLPKGHRLVFLNYSDRLRVAERYNTWMDNVDIVYNPVREYEYKETSTTGLVKNVFDNKEVRIAYAFCTTRMGAKGVGKLLKLAGKIKNNGKSVGVCLMNSNANADREKKAIENMSKLAVSYGLTKDDFIFTSTISGLELGVPNDVVRNMFKLSNLFIFPTISECCSLILLEAMYGGNLLVLNDDIPSMKEFGGFDTALYMKFGSIFQETNYSNEDSYYNDYAKIIIRQLGTNIADKAKQRVKLFSEDAIWDKQMKELF